jgi:hypothetical protein
MPGFIVTSVVPLLVKGVQQCLMLATRAEGKSTPKIVTFLGQHK